MKTSAIELTAISILTFLYFIFYNYSLLINIYSPYTKFISLFVAIAFFFTLLPYARNLTKFNTINKKSIIPLIIISVYFIGVTVLKSDGKDIVRFLYTIFFIFLSYTIILLSINKIISINALINSYIIAVVPHAIVGILAFILVGSGLVDLSSWTFKFKDFFDQTAPFYGRTYSAPLLLSIIAKDQYATTLFGFQLYRIFAYSTESSVAASLAMPAFFMSFRLPYPFRPLLVVLTMTYLLVIGSVGVLLVVGAVTVFWFIYNRSRRLAFFAGSSTVIAVVYLLFGLFSNKPVPLFQISILHLHIMPMRRVVAEGFQLFQNAGFFGHGYSAGLGPLLVRSFLDFGWIGLAIFVFIYTSILIKCLRLLQGEHRHIAYATIAIMLFQIFKGGKYDAFLNIFLMLYVVLIRHDHGYTCLPRKWWPTHNPLFNNSLPQYVIHHDDINSNIDDATSSL